MGCRRESSCMMEGLSVSKEMPQPQGKLPQPFLRRETLVNSYKIANAVKLKKWNYLERISEEIGENQAKIVKLLIGANSLQAFEPIEIIADQENAPYAFKLVMF